MSGEHTPGPWFLINDHCVGGPIEPGWEAAGCGIAHCGMRARTVEEAAANARLIAAAPEMFEALRQVDREMRGGFGSSFGETREQIRRALSKATGGVRDIPDSPTPDKSEAGNDHG